MIRTTITLPVELHQLLRYQALEAGIGLNELLLQKIAGQEANVRENEGQKLQTLFGTWKHRQDIKDTRQANGVPPVALIIFIIKFGHHDGFAHRVSFLFYRRHGQRSL